MVKGDFVGYEVLEESRKSWEPLDIEVNLSRRNSKGKMLSKNVIGRVESGSRVIGNEVTEVAGGNA